MTLVRPVSGRLIALFLGGSFLVAGTFLATASVTSTDIVHARIASDSNGLYVDLPPQPPLQPGQLATVFAGERGMGLPVVSVEPRGNVQRVRLALGPSHAQPSVGSLATARITGVRHSLGAWLWSRASGAQR